MTRAICRHRRWCTYYRELLARAERAFTLLRTLPQVELKELDASAASLARTRTRLRIAERQMRELLLAADREPTR